MPETPPLDPAATPTASPKLKRYTHDSVDVAELKNMAEEILGVTPFQWQLDAAVAILCGENLILDVGTGCGKSLCFILALLFDQRDIAITVMPLTALMLDQTKDTKIPTLAICQESIKAIGRAKLYEVRAIMT
ncbi:DEAD domain-containing protein [Mycena indigotica]|uniref:DEAD domain-containing protein n=1 Tax=Mycena indigotica TaxID=2126181 RepID=A0A8H6VSH4_9AGAR|nr:DEAD domain-containing protein [Mycena indigotica]KAF7292214.1 DEAD domain-containing protein [Mycena indigotica]